MKINDTSVKWQLIEESFTLILSYLYDTWNWVGYRWRDILLKLQATAYMKDNLFKQYKEKKS